MSFFNKIYLSITALLVGACTQAGFIAANYPIDKSALNIETNISYGTEEVQKLDVYSLKDYGDNLPVIIFFYGGEYTNGSKDDYLFMADYLARQGYVVVLPDYAKYPDVKFPAFVDDGAKAVEWVVENIGEYDGDAEHITISGHSAGAHIAALLTFDQSYGAADKIEKFIGLAGPYSFVPRERKYMNIFSETDDYFEMHVDNYVDGNEAPAYLLHGEEDKIVGEINMEKLENAIIAKSGRVESDVIEGVDHIGIISAFTGVASNEKVREAFLEYLKR